MSIVVDFAWFKPSVAQMKSWGTVAGVGYLSTDPSKNMTRAEVNSFADAGIKTILVWETTSDRVTTGGNAGGIADAQAARSQAAALGKPDWAPIFLACDEDIPDYDPGSTDPKAKLGPAAYYL